MGKLEPGAEHRSFRGRGRDPLTLPEYISSEKEWASETHQVEIVDKPGNNVLLFGMAGKHNKREA